MRKDRLILALIFLFGFLGQSQAAKVKTVKTKGGWQLLVNGRPYFIRGMCYYPVKVGESPGEGTQRDWMYIDDDSDGRVDAAYQSWIDKNRNNIKDKDEPEVGDFKLLQQMGCNTIRVYHHASDRKELQKQYIGHRSAELLYNHPPNKALLRDLYRTYGIRVAMGDFLGAYGLGSGASWSKGTDYTNKKQRKAMMRSVRAMVEDFKDEPFILMWVLGNENNYEKQTKTNSSKHPEVYAKFVNDVAKMIKKIDPHHPVVLCNGETKMIYAYADRIPDVDIFGINTYRRPNFGNLWDQVASKLDKPVVLTEFGSSHPVITNGLLNEDHQAKVHKQAWCDIEKHAAGGQTPRNSIGGFVFAWMDNWWQNGSPYSLNLDEGRKWNNEVNGMAGQGDGKSSLFLRELRKVYYTYKDLWTGEKTCD